MLKSKKSFAVPIKLVVGQRDLYKMAKKLIRTRIAPSPTGFAHIGTAYVALFNYAFSKKYEGNFILRLEDTDLKRNIPGAEDAIYAGLSWLGISWDEGPDKGGKYGPYRQSERLGSYQEKAQNLLANKLAYKDENAIRFNTRQYEEKIEDWIAWNDLVRGHVRFKTDQLTDFVILKSDGYPTYNFAAVSDDIDMKITHVIRGEEHISNTPRQLALYKAFGAEIPVFAHLPTIRNKQRKKLSKRHDSVDLREFQHHGYLPEALVNFLCLLGWSHPSGKEIFSLNEFVANFDMKRVRRSGPIFDTQKLDWINGVYIRKKSDAALSELINDYITAEVTKDFLLQVVPLIRDRIHRLEEAEKLLAFFWEKPQVGRGLFADKDALKHLSTSIAVLGELHTWNLESINDALAVVIREHKFNTGKFYMTLRIAITGKRITPPINESMVILGQDEVIERLKEAEKALLD